jgi:uncharacterized membrane protein
MPLRSRALFLLPAVLAAAAVIACSSSPNDPADAGGSTCVSAPACPAGGAPSYKTEIQPILQAACIPCHSPGGTAGYDESSYSDVYNQFGAILSQVAICVMPPVNGPQLTDAQRVALTAWLKCGAPDN